MSEKSQGLYTMVKRKTLLNNLVLMDVKKGNVRDSLKRTIIVWNSVNGNSHNEWQLTNIYMYKVFNVMMLSKSVLLAKAITSDYNM